MSTSAREAHARAAGGMPSVDAPVSGGVGGATAGTLTFMVGGTRWRLRRGQPILETMGRKIVHCGEAGDGQAAKICNNMILGVSMIAVSEAFVLGRKAGAVAPGAVRVASTSSGQCWSLTSYCPVPGPVPASPANNGYKPGFAAALMLKDLKLAQEAADESRRRHRARPPRRADLYDFRRDGACRSRFLGHRADGAGAVGTRGGVGRIGARQVAVAGHLPVSSIVTGAPQGTSVPLRIA